MGFEERLVCQKAKVFTNSSIVEINPLTSSISYCFIRIDAFVKIPAVKQVLKQFLDLGNASGATNQHNVMDLRLVHLGIPKRLFHRLQRTTEQVGVELLKTCSGDGSVEVGTFEQRVDLNAGLRAGGKGALGALTCCPQATDCTFIAGDVFLELALELGNEVVDHSVVEILTSQMGVTCGRLDFKNAILNC